uniref:Uncharacterized protein n=1 Tax=Brassica oleracea var. oleracea TaxID=109376 RepID=A0A0D3D3U5_BRAOL
MLERYTRPEWMSTDVRMLISVVAAEISCPWYCVSDMSDFTFGTNRPRFVASSTNVCLRMSVDMLLRLSIDADSSGRRCPELYRSLLPTDLSLLWCENLVETSSEVSVVDCCRSMLVSVGRSMYGEK